MDWLGDKVVNGYTKEDYEKHERTAKTYEEKAKSAKTKLGEWYYNIMAKKETNKASKIKGYYDASEALISDYRDKNKEDFDRIDNYPQDVEVKVVGPYDLKTILQKGGYIFLKGRLASSSDSKTKKQKFVVSVASCNKKKETPTLSDRKTLGHEFGHAWYKWFFNDGTYDKEHFIDQDKGGHESNPRKDSGIMEENPDGKEAEEWEKRTK